VSRDTEPSAWERQFICPDCGLWNDCDCPDDKYNWESVGPGGCDDHCIEHPCGKCITGSFTPREFRDRIQHQLFPAVPVLAEPKVSKASPASGTTHVIDEARESITLDYRDGTRVADSRGGREPIL
jgi:hypothetical protein